MAETILSNKFFTYEVDGDGIAVITIDQKDNPTNLFSYEFIQEYISTAHKAIADDKIKGVILTSGRRMFMAGADLRELEKQSASAEEQLEAMMKMHQGMRAVSYTHLTLPTKA